MIRVLGLGNDLIADDGCGIAAAREIERAGGDAVEVVCTGTAGFDLLDHLVGASRLLVLDTLATGASDPGTLHEVDEGAVTGAPGGSAHYVGLFEALALGRALGLAMPAEVRILAMEPADCLTVGGEMTAPVRAALPSLVARALDVLGEWRRA